MTQSIELPELATVRVPLVLGRRYSVQAEHPQPPVFLRIAEDAPAADERAWFRLGGDTGTVKVAAESLWARTGADPSGAGAGNRLVFDECD